MMMTLQRAKPSTLDLLGEGTKRRNDDSNERLAQNNKTPNGVAPAPKGTVTQEGKNCWNY